MSASSSSSSAGPSSSCGNSLTLPYTSKATLRSISDDLIKESASKALSSLSDLSQSNIDPTSCTISYIVIGQLAIQLRNNYHQNNQSFSAYKTQLKLIESEIKLLEAEMLELERRAQNLDQRLQKINKDNSDIKELQTHLKAVRLNKCQLEEKYEQLSTKIEASLSSFQQTQLKLYTQIEMLYRLVKEGSPSDEYMITRIPTSKPELPDSKSTQLSEASSVAAAAAAAAAPAAAPAASAASASAAAASASVAAAK